MTYNEKKKLCKEINNDRIYEEISHGIVCSCFRDVNGVERLEVSHSDFPIRIRSTPCVQWPEYHITEWIITATIELWDFVSFNEETSDSLEFEEVPFD